jgi:hypothetical protein
MLGKPARQDPSDNLTISLRGQQQPRNQMAGIERAPELSGVIAA